MTRMGGDIMPQINIRGIKVEEVCKVSHELIDKLTQAVGCPRDYFEIECISSAKVTNGVVEEPYPFVEVAWFDRGQQIQDQVARTITDVLMKGLGIESLDLAFRVFEKEKYYENGEHF